MSEYCKAWYLASVRRPVRRSISLAFRGHFVETTPYFNQIEYGEEVEIIAHNKEILNYHPLTLLAKFSDRLKVFFRQKIAKKKATPITITGKDDNLIINFEGMTSEQIDDWLVANDLLEDEDDDDDHLAYSI